MITEAPVMDSTDEYAVAFTYPFLAGIDPANPPSKIHIPDKFMDAMGNMERQYWEIKSANYDVMLFFKKGTFYELYDYDAVIGSREFGLKMAFDTGNRGKMRLAGVPEKSFSEWARLFVFRGYKVGRVEQLKADSDDGSSKVKVIPRGLVQILTPGTLKDPSMISDHNEIFLLSIFPRIAVENGVKRGLIDSFAVDLSRRIALRCPCSQELSLPRVEADLSVVKIEQGVAPQNLQVEKPSDLLSNVSLLALSALLQQLNPKEIIIPDASWFSKSGEEAPFYEAMCKQIVLWARSEGFVVELLPLRRKLENSIDQEENCAEVLLTSYFTTLHLTGDIPLLRDAERYTAHLSGSTQSEKSQFSATSQACSTSSRTGLLAQERRQDPGLGLDAVTVSNLELLNNLQDGSSKNSLLQCLNFCSTNGGRRLFRSWILRPSSSAQIIKYRQEGVRFLHDYHLTMAGGSDLEDGVMLSPGQKRSRSSAELDSVSSDCSTTLAGVDIERLLSRLCDMRQEESHDISYVDPMAQYRKNLGLILTSVRSFSAMALWASNFYSACTAAAGGDEAKIPPILSELLGNITAATASTQKIEKLFDQEEAEKTGLLVPAPGTSEKFDAAMDKIKGLEAQLEGARKRLQQSAFHGAAVIYSDLGKDLFLMEVSAADAPKMTPQGMVERARSAKSVRYVVDCIKEMVEEHKKAMTEKSNALLTVLCSVATRICAEIPLLHAASSALSYLDCLFNLSRLGEKFPRWCFPKIMEPLNGMASLEARELIHPLLAPENPVPNAISLSHEHGGRILLLTGPNMAGKSTLMRTVAMGVIMAQLGGPVLASEMRLAPVDRIFTRIGARDASHKGQSTLFVELSETADLLRRATARSLCFVDELGRGTSTHDGMAIAHATLEDLKHRSPAPPLSIFSTHYHAIALAEARSSVCADGASGVALCPAGSSKLSAVQLGYMDFRLCQAAGGSDVANVVFLYNLVSGICARSYGVEVALMAGIPRALVRVAKEKSEELSRQSAILEDARTLLGFMK